MRRPLCGAAIIVAAMLIEPLTDTPPDIRLDAGAGSHVPAPSVAVLRFTHDVPLNEGDGKHLIVDGTLNGSVTGPLLIDTGASYCVVTRTTARRLGLHPTAKRSIPVATANGKVDADLVTIDTMQIRGARLAEVDAVIMDAVEPPLIGIVGLSFLTQFRFSVDPTEGTLRLER